jgi:hypothetical protein
MARRGLIVAAWVLVIVACGLYLVGYDRLTYTDVVPDWAYFAAIVGPCVAVGAAMERLESFVAPGLFATVIAVGDASYLAAVAFFFAFVMLGLATGLGWVAARLVQRAAVPLAAVGVAVAVAGLIPLAVAEVAYATAPRLPSEAAARLLPEDGDFSGLCAGQNPTDNENALRRDRALIRELSARPDHVVRVAYIVGEGETKDVDISVRALAEEELDYLEGRGPDCHADIQDELREGLE